jgi:F420-dependent oxidoreductase-like protein
MRLGLTIGGRGARPSVDMELVLEAERLGFDSVWSGESWGSDAVTPVAWVLSRTTKLKAGTGIMQMSARTPACAAMTAMTLQALSGNRFLCGVGPSGPQVIEGWHGQAYGKPLARTREYIGIIKDIIAREKPLMHQGEHYRIPYDGPGATGLGKPLRSITHGEKGMKFYTASITPAGVRLSGEIADGNIPIFMSPEGAEAVLAPLREGMAKADGPKTLADFDNAPHVKIRIGDDPSAPDPPGRLGRVWFTSSWYMEGYGFPPDLAPREHRHGWWPTHDVGSLDEAGYPKAQPPRRTAPSPGNSQTSGTRPSFRRGDARARLR